MQKKLQKLFSNQIKMDIVYRFYKEQNENPKLQIENPKTSFDLIYGYSQNEIIEEESKEIVNKITSNEVAQRCEKEGITTSEIKGAFESMMSNVRENLKHTQKDGETNIPGKGEN